MRRNRLILATALLTLWTPLTSHATEPDAEGIAFFEKRVRPVLVESCYDCHSEDAVESELRLDSLAAMLTGGSRGPAIVIGEPKQSLLISAINHDDRLHMPPKQKLPRKAIADITEWIRRGAPWPNAKPITPVKRSSDEPITFSEEEKNFWSFQSPRRPTLPEVENQKWVQSPIDRFVLAKLEQAGLNPAKPASKNALIRRATIELTGLPPTPDEVKQFLTDESPNAFESLIDRLLASPRFGERWGRHWLDIARYADSNGLDENLAYAHAYRYRDYVIAAFNKDKPYDRFVQEQIAGDLLTQDADREAVIEGLTATGFLSIGAKMLAEDDPVKMQMDIIDEQIDTIGRAVIGITVGCARCHDHKFDPLPTADYYSLAGIFKSTKTMENFKVVARWQERPLASPEEIAERDAEQSQINALQTQSQQIRQAASDRLLAAERQRTDAYLLAAEQLRQRNERLKQAQSIGRQLTSSIPNEIHLIEAEDFARGNVKKDFGTYGKAIGVLVNIGNLPNFTEYEIDLPTAGLFQLEIRVAAAQARPVQLSINGHVVKTDAAATVTGSWLPDSQAWIVEGFYNLPAGKNVIRFERAGPFPHIDKLLLALLQESDAELLGDSEQSDKNDPSGLKPELVQQWLEFLSKQGTDPKSPFAVWNRFAATGKLNSADQQLPAQWQSLIAEPAPKTLTELADRYQLLFADVDRQWSELKNQATDSPPSRLPNDQLEALRLVLYGGDSPFQQWKSREIYFPVDIRDRLAELDSETKTRQAALPQFAAAMSVSEGTPEDLRVHIRGSHTTLGETVLRRFPRILDHIPQPEIAEASSGRLELARWLTSDQHPLTARVMVNRLWLHLFGEGIVRTPDNFGRLGERPTHPELLDWLAVEFVEQGWSVKSMLKTIMLSSTYQMSCQLQRTADERDPENRLLWRMNRQRLEAEVIRDALLSIAGNLDLSTGGSLLPTENRKYVTSTASVDPVVYVTNRRSVYLPVVRSALYDVFQAFDFADPSVLNGRRSATMVAPQALFMMNSELITMHTKSWAEKLLANEQLDDQSRVKRIYIQSFSRAPSEQEIAQALAYISDYESAATQSGQTEADSRLAAWQSFCRALIASNEFIFVN